MSTQEQTAETRDAQRPGINFFDPAAHRKLRGDGESDEPVSLSDAFQKAGETAEDGEDASGEGRKAEGEGAPEKAPAEDKQANEAPAKEAEQAGEDADHDDGDGGQENAGEEAAPEEGEEDSEKALTQADIDKAIEKRMGRMKRKHDREMRTLKEENKRLQMELADNGAEDAGDEPAADAADAAGGKVDLGPQIQDYANTEDWNRDFEAYMEGSPWPVDPKGVYAQSRKGGRRQAESADDGRETDPPAQQEARRRAEPEPPARDPVLDMFDDIIERTDVAAEKGKGVPKDLADRFRKAVHSESIRLSNEMVRAMSERDDCHKVVRAFVDEPYLSRQMVRRNPEDTDKALDKVVADFDKASKAAKQKLKQEKKSGQVFPDLHGGAGAVEDRGIEHIDPNDPEYYVKYQQERKRVGSSEGGFLIT